MAESDSSDKTTKEFDVGRALNRAPRLDSSVDTDPYAPTHVPVSPSKVAEPTGPDALIGQRVGDYQIIERLGVGGMGVVYAGLQPIIGKTVAIKVLRPSVANDPRQAERLFFEARAVAQIKHRGIIDIFTVGQLQDGRHYLVMEMLDGESLSELLLRRGSLPAKEALIIVDEVLSALGAAHAAGIIHRDLKPSNIFVVTQSDGSTFVKLLDFGLAKRSAPSSPGSPQTLPDVFVGTPEYVAPEQARGGLVSAQTDLYALGVVLFELLTGRLPFVAKSTFELVMHHLETKPDAPSVHKGGVPAAVDGLTLGLLAKDPTQRPKSTDEVRAVIARILKMVQVQDEVGGDNSRKTVPSSEDFVLRLGTRFELGLSWITSSLDQLQRAHPHRNIHLAFGDSPDLIRQLRDAQLDCAVTSARLRADWIRRMDLHEETYNLVISPELWREGILQSDGDANALALLDVHADLPLFRYFSDAEPRAQRWAFRRIEVLGTIAAVRHRAMEGAGLAVLPSYFIQEQLRHGVLIRLFPEVELQRDRFRLIWREGHPREADLEQLGRELRGIPLR